MNEKQKQFLDELSKLMHEYKFYMIRVDFSNGIGQIKFENPVTGDLSFSNYYNGRFENVFVYKPETIESYVPEVK